MNLRRVAGIIAVLALCAVFVAGALFPQRRHQPRSTVTSTAATRDRFLERYVTLLEHELRNNTTVSLWVAKWQNASAVSVEATFRNVTSNQDVNLNRTVMRFASIEDASNYAESNYANATLTTNHEDRIFTI
jgi:hypothetical protein